MTELLLPRLKQEIEARLAELRPLIAEIDQLEAAKAALLSRSRNVAPRADRDLLPAAPTARRPSPPATVGGDGDGDGAPEEADGQRQTVIALVEERPGVSIAEIAAVTKIPATTVADLVAELKRSGTFTDEAGGVKLASRQPVTLAAVFGERP